jgi:hypothetical protein
LNNQPGTPRRQAVHRMAESVAPGEGFGNPGMAWLGLVRRCAVSEA